MYHLRDQKPKFSICFRPWFKTSNIYVPIRNDASFNKNINYEFCPFPSKLIGLSNSRTGAALGFFFFFFGAVVSDMFRPFVSIGSKAHAIVAISVTMPYTEAASC